jgi:hypothetical protein
MPFETIYKELRVPVFQNPRTSDFMVFFKGQNKAKIKEPSVLVFPEIPKNRPKP